MRLVGCTVCALPGRRFVDNLVEFYKDGDAGVVTEVLKDDRGVERISIHQLGRIHVVICL